MCAVWWLCVCVCVYRYTMRGWYTAVGPTDQRCASLLSVSTCWVLRSQAHSTEEMHYSVVCRVGMPVCVCVVQGWRNGYVVAYRKEECIAEERRWGFTHR